MHVVNLTKEAEFRMKNYEWIPETEKQIWRQLIASLCVDMLFQDIQVQLRNYILNRLTMFKPENLSDVLYSGASGVIVNSKSNFYINPQCIKRWKLARIKTN